MEENRLDLTFATKTGVFNLRVGALMIHEQKILMVTNDLDHYYYSVGGRVRMNETLECAVVREVLRRQG